MGFEYKVNKNIFEQWKVHIIMIISDTKKVTRIKEKRIISILLKFIAVNKKLIKYAME